MTAAGSLPNPFVSAADSFSDDLRAIYGVSEDDENIQGASDLLPARQDKRSRHLLHGEHCSANRHSDFSCSHLAASHRGPWQSVMCLHTLILMLVCP